MWTSFYFLSRWFMGIIGDCKDQNDKILVLPYGTMAKDQNCISFSIHNWTPVSAGNLDGPLAWNTISVPYGDLKDCLGVRRAAGDSKGAGCPKRPLARGRTTVPKSQQSIFSSPKSIIRPLPTQCCVAAPAKECYFLPFCEQQPWYHLDVTALTLEAYFVVPNGHNIFSMQTACLRKRDNDD